MIMSSQFTIFFTRFIIIDHDCTMRDAVVVDVATASLFAAVVKEVVDEASVFSSSGVVDDEDDSKFFR